MTDLKSKTLNGVIWSFVDAFGVYFIRFGFTIAIARKLAPRDYGLVGMIAIFIALSTLIIEGGFSTALIQKKETTKTDYSTVFFFNIFTALILYFLLYFTAGFISDFYNEPQLKLIIRVAGIGIILGSLITIHVTILAKNLDFKKQAIINATSALSSGITGIILAFHGYGVWSLILQTLMGSTISVSLFWMMQKWRPQFIFSFSSFASLYKYGINIFLQGFTGVILSNIYYPLIGKFYKASELGFFSNADRFYQIFVQRITIAYGRAAFSSFAQLQDDSENFVIVYRKSTLALAFFLIPFTAFLIVSAKPLILFLLTNKWAMTIPYLQLLYLDGFFFPFYQQNQNILCALGKSNLSLKVDLIKKASILLGIIFTFQIGVKALIISQILSTIIGFFYGNYCLSKIHKLQNVSGNIFQIIFLTLFCVFCSLIVEYLFNNYLIIILLQLAIFFGYIIINKVFRLVGYCYFLSFFDSLIPINMKRYF